MSETLERAMWESIKEFFRTMFQVTSLETVDPNGDSEFKDPFWDDNFKLNLDESSGPVQVAKMHRPEGQ